MIGRLFLIGTLSLLGVATTTAAQANWITECCNSVIRDFKRRQCWPQPFVCPDRAAARAPFAVMVNNGWRRQNMLGEYHFRPEDGNLTEAGKLKVHWILTAAPQEHRTVFVHSATDATTTAARIDSVQQYAAKIVPDGDLPSVQLTDIPEVGWPADQVNAIGQRLYATMPDPRLPAAKEASAN